MTTKRTARVLVLAAIATTFGLAACGGEGSGESTSASSTTPPSTSAAASKANWQQEDPCSLLTERDTEQYLGDSASVTPQRTDTMGRPRCEWKGSGTGEVKLMLWQPPVPDVITDTDKTVLVGKTTGYITSETSSSCHMDVKAKPAFLQLEVRTSDLDSGEKHYCRTVAKTAEGVLGKLGW